MLRFLILLLSSLKNKIKIRSDAKNVTPPSLKTGGTQIVTPHVV